MIHVKKFKRYRLVKEENGFDKYWYVQYKFMLLWMFPIWLNVDEYGSIKTFQTMDEAYDFVKAMNKAKIRKVFHV
jgi:hypothetical protein